MPGVDSLAGMLSSSYTQLFFHKDQFCSDCFLKFVIALSIMVVEMVENHIDDPTLKDAILDSFPHVEMISAIH